MKTVKKMCHNCFKWKELWKFRGYYPYTYYIKEKATENTCFDCGELGRPRTDEQKFWALCKNSQQEYFYNELRILRESYECAFIGNTSYKDICKVYRITHENTQS